MTGGEESTPKTEALPETKPSTPSATAGTDTQGTPATPEMPAGITLES